MGTVLFPIWLEEWYFPGWEWGYQMTAKDTATPAAPSRGELLARVAVLAPLLEATAAKSESLRTLCPEAVDALHDAGLFGLWSNTDVGGYDTDLVTQLEVMVAVARADMSACWTLMIGTSLTAIMAAGLPDQGLAEVFGGPRLPTAAGSIKPSGRAEIVEGGYRVTGRWGFGSGIHHASQIVANCLVTKDGTPVAPGDGTNVLMAVVPIADVTIEDDWHVSGLRGSGSSSYAVADIFVPEHLTIKLDPAVTYRGGVPGANLLLRLPLEHAGVSLGGARHALDEVARQALSKHRLIDAQSVADKQAFQLELGKLEAQWETLYASARESAGGLWQAYRGDPKLIPNAAIKLRAICAHATEQCLEIGTRAMRHAGAGAVLEANVLQRINRDLTVSAQHVMISDVSYEDYGRALLGL